MRWAVDRSPLCGGPGIDSRRPTPALQLPALLVPARRTAKDAVTDPGPPRRPVGGSRLAGGRADRGRVGLRRADQAADHRAAARHHGSDDVPRGARAARRCGWSLATLVGGTMAAGAAPTRSTATSTATSTRVMHRTEQPPARHRRGVAARRRSSSASRSACRVDAVARAAGQLARRGARARRDPVLRRRLHDAAQAAHRAEHRLGRRGGLHAGAHRLVGGHRLAGLGAVRPVRASSSSGRRRTTGRCR